MAQSDRSAIGRAHHKEAYTLWMPGGGTRGGAVVGQTDVLGYQPVEDPVHIHDFNATILHLLGMDHEKLTFRFRPGPSADRCARARGEQGDRVTAASVV